MVFSLSTAIEFLGTVTGIIYLYYSVNERIELWYWGFVSSLFAVATFALAHLYSEAVLQVYYLAISVYGWYLWKFGVVENNSSQQLTITKVSKRQIFSLTLWFIFIYLLILVLLIKGPKYLDISPTQVPYLDGFCTAGSIIGTLMLSRKILENWLVWIVVDFFGIGVTAYKELYFYSLLFVIYTSVALLGYIKWKMLYCNKSES